MIRNRNWGRRAALAAAVSALGVAVLAGAASSKSTAPSGTYKGKTSNGLIVTFRIQSGKVRNFSATVHALCISVATGSSYLDPVLHQITPPPMKLAGNGKFSGEYVPQTASTHGKIDGRVTGKSANGHYRISYTATSGLSIYACQERGTWKATKR